MHLFIMNNVVEIVTGLGQPVNGPPGGDSGRHMGDGAAGPAPQAASHENDARSREGRIVVTNLHNLVFPMIRYDIGDTGSLGNDKCPCGSELPTLAKLTGRVTDHFVRREGGLVHGEYFTHIFYFRPWIESFQVDQLTYDHVRVRVVPTGLVNDSDVAEITGAIQLAMGQQCNVEWHFVDQIDKSPQGKHRYTRSYLHQA